MEAMPSAFNAAREKRVWRGRDKGVWTIGLIIVLSGCTRSLHKREQDAAARAWRRYDEIELSYGAMNAREVEEARTALLSCGKTAIPAVAKTLLCPQAEPPRRACAIEILQEIGDRQALPYLRRALGFRDTFVATEAATAITWLGGDKDAVPILCRELEENVGGGRGKLLDWDIYERNAFVWALGVSCRPERPELLGLLSHGDPRVRVMGIRVLRVSRYRFLEPNAYWHVVPTLIEMLGDNDLDNPRRPEDEWLIPARSEVLWLLQALTFNPTIGVNEKEAEACGEEKASTDMVYVRDPDLWAQCQRRWRAWDEEVAALTRADRVRRAWRARERWSDKEERLPPDEQWAFALAMGDDPDKYVVGETLRWLALAHMETDCVPHWYPKLQVGLMVRRLRRWTGRGIPLPHPLTVRELVVQARQLSVWWQRNRGHMRWDENSQRLIDTRG